MPTLLDQLPQLMLTFILTIIIFLVLVIILMVLGVAIGLPRLIRYLLREPTPLTGGDKLLIMTSPSLILLCVVKPRAITALLKALHEEEVDEIRMVATAPQAR